MLQGTGVTMQTAVLDIYLSPSSMDAWVGGACVCGVLDGRPCRWCCLLGLPAVTQWLANLYVPLEGGLFLRFPPPSGRPSSLTAHCYCLGWLEDGCC